MSQISRFRLALQEQLSNDLSMQFFPGRFEGPNTTERNLGSVFVQRSQQVAGNVESKQLFALVRAYLRYDNPQSAEDVWDPTPLEDLAESLEQSIGAHQASIDGVWFQQLVSIELDPAVQGLEAVVMGWTSNPAVVV